MSQKVRIIPATINRVTATPMNSKTKRKVAGYARVSTDQEEQQTSYEAQVTYYTDYIKSRPDWEFVKVYTDEGISGTSTQHREGFQEMVADALEGKISLIVTKSVSRFARNTVDSLTTIRKLKEHGTEVYFEKENIWTFDTKGELLITIMSSIAQEESRSISLNVTWGWRKRFADGRPVVPFGRFLGFDRGEKGEFVVNEEEADTVRLIYAEFLSGHSFRTIARKLTDLGVKSPTGNDKWYDTTISSILTNEKYKGCALLQKGYTEDYLTKKYVKNNGEVPQYFVEGSHPYIIEPEVFDRVQDLIALRKKNKQYSGSTIFSSKIRCGCCGGWFGSKVWHSTDKYRRVIWWCNGKYGKPANNKGVVEKANTDEVEKVASTDVADKKKPTNTGVVDKKPTSTGGVGEVATPAGRCTTPHLSEDEIKAAFIKVVNKLAGDRGALLADLREIQATCTVNKELEARIRELDEQLNADAEAVEQLIDTNARVAQNQEEYSKQYEEIVNRYEAAKAERDALAEEKRNNGIRRREFERFIKNLETLPEVVTEFDEALWGSLVEYMTVYEKNNIVFTLPCGTEIRA